MATYQIYIYDDAGHSIELDTEDIDTKTIIALADITDITTRKSSFNTLQLKGTKTNTYAFGNWNDFSRTTDLSNDTGLFFNYNPLKGVHTLIYENGNLVFRGTLRIQDAPQDKNGNVIYNAVLTSSLTELRTVIQDALLSDLDLSDLQHRYTNMNIVSSWTNYTEIYNASTSAYTTTPFAYGKNYVYPLIDYGYIYTGRTDTNQFHIRNFKCALYCQEIIDRIFKQASCSYEIKASSDFKTMFKHLIIPDNQETTKHPNTGFITKYSKPLPVLFNQTVYNLDTINGTSTPIFDNNRLVPIQQISYPASAPSKFLDLYNPIWPDVLQVKRGFNSAAQVKLSINAINDANVNPDGDMNIIIKLVKRLNEDNRDPYSSWQAVGQTVVPLPYGATFNNVIQVNIGLNDFKVGEQLAVMVNIQFPQNGSLRRCIYDVFACELVIPPTVNDVITIDVEPSLVNGDIVTPVPPSNLKQTDFLKAIINQFNFYVYSTNDNPKHFVFEKYDDFYVLALPQYIKDNSIDWTSKIDYKKGFRAKANIDLPKSYLFTYKPDADVLNTIYKDTFNEIYGSLSFADPYGLVEQKKLELIFSPTIISTEEGTDRKYAWLYKVDDNNIRKPIKTNPRLLYYNGMMPCQRWKAINVTTSPTGTTVQEYQDNLGSYPQASNYYMTGFTNPTVINDIHWSIPRQIYFRNDLNFLNASTSYQNYYINQVTDLTNQNVIYLEADVLLNEIDMANLDLHVPVYISTGENNAAYFKVLKVEYDGSNSSSKVLLQKIGF